MSLAETQEIMRTIQEIMVMLGKMEAKTEKAVSQLPQTKEAVMTFMQMERIALRYLVIARRMGLPDDVAKATQLLTQMIVTVRMLQMSYRMLTLSTPFGWLMGGAGLLLSGFAIYDTVTGV